jgi:hypothetical protein
MTSVRTVAALPSEMQPPGNARHLLRPVVSKGYYLSTHPDASRDAVPSISTPSLCNQDRDIKAAT